MIVRAPGSSDLSVSFFTPKGVLVSRKDVRAGENYSFNGSVMARGVYVAQVKGVRGEVLLRNKVNIVC